MLQDRLQLECSGHTLAIARLARVLAPPTQHYDLAVAAHRRGARTNVEVAAEHVALEATPLQRLEAATAARILCYDTSRVL